MAKFKFAERLYVDAEIIKAKFRAHESTILQLASRYKVGQETMRQFLIISLGEEYHEIVRELREMLRLNNSQSVLSRKIAGEQVEMQETRLTRRMKDFSEEEIKEFKRRIECMSVNFTVPYHPFIENPLLGDDRW